MLEDTSNLELSPHDRQELQRILKACIPGFEVWAFGSRAKGTAKPYSDLDLVIITEQVLPIETLAELTDSLSNSDMTMKVDVLDWATISEPFQKIIQKDKIVIQTGKNRF